MYIDDISRIHYRVGNCCHLVDIVILFDLWFAHHWLLHNTVWDLKITRNATNSKIHWKLRVPVFHSTVLYHGLGLHEKSHFFLYYTLFYTFIKQYRKIVPRRHSYSNAAFSKEDELKFAFVKELCLSKIIAQVSRKEPRQKSFLNVKLCSVLFWNKFIFGCMNEWLVNPNFDILQVIYYLV